MKKLGIGAFILFTTAYWTAYAAKNEGFAVGPQYDTTHVYVAPEEFERFVASFVSTFGGKASKQGVFQVTPTFSEAMSQLALTPAGTISVFGFKTAIPYPFGTERTGYLVNDFDKAIAAARSAGADVIVSPFTDSIGRNAIIQWAGGVNMQIYWNTTPPSYEPLATIPENRVYISPERANLFAQQFNQFAGGKIVTDDPKAPGIEIGQPGTTYRRISIDSGFGKMLVIVTNGHLTWPYGREMAGYEVSNLKQTLYKAQAVGSKVLVAPVTSGGRIAAMVQFPGGYIVEIHELTKNNTMAHKSPIKP